tara:strand:- start:276 stop:1088 length:813 start_codon:yes stop_codon:yes gene_type:complete
MSIKIVYCTNCGKNGHNYKNCKNPIISYGVMLFKKELDDFKLLLVQRKDSIAYIEFIRGKYSITNTTKLFNILENITKNELANILNYDFDYLWNTLWSSNIDSTSLKKFEKEYSASFKKFNYIKSRSNTINIYDIIKVLNITYNETEWGIPKGRRNLNELDIEVANREFQEETNLSSDDYTIINSISPIRERFLGTNKLKYDHIYYIAITNKDINPIINRNNINQIIEIKNIKWFNRDSAVKIIRKYETEKKKIIHIGFNIINSIKEYLI